MKDMILCSKCKVPKELNEYYLYSNGKANQPCRECTLRASKLNYKRKGGIEALRKWRAENPELYMAQRKRQKERRKFRLKTDSVYAEKLREEKRVSSKKNFISGMLGRAKQRAIKYNVEFNITHADVIVPELCPILEVPLIRGTKGDYRFSPSIDRLRPEFGYIPGNIQVISTQANWMKNVATKEQLLTFCRNIPAYLQNMI